MSDLRTATIKGGAMYSLVAVFIGAGLGGLLRHGVNLASLKLLGSAFPYHTLTINIVGSLAMGLIGGYFALRTQASQEFRLFLTTGIIGGFTTFSAFSLDAALLYERGAILQCVAYVHASVVGSIAAVFIGLSIVRHYA